MARQDRNAIFEQVVLKDRKETEAKQEVVLFETTREGDGGEPSPRYGSAARHFRMARQSSEASVDYDTTIRNNAIPEGQEQEKENPGPTGVGQDGADMGRSIENATYAYKAKENNGTYAVLSLNPGKVFKIIFLIIALICVLILALLGLGLASSNNVQVTKLQHTAVDEATYQLEIGNFQEMLSNMKEQMSALNSSVIELSGRLEQMTEQLITVNITHNQQMASIQGRIDNQSNTLTEVKSQLDVGLNNTSERISALEGAQNTSQIKLNALVANVEDLQSRINTLKSNLSSPVGVYEDCITCTNATTITILFSSNDTQLQHYAVSTEPVNIGERVSDDIRINACLPLHL